MKCLTDQVKTKGPRGYRGVFVCTTEKAPCAGAFLAQREGFAPLAARPGEQPTGLFSLRPTLL